MCSGEFFRLDAQSRLLCRARDDSQKGCHCEERSDEALSTPIVSAEQRPAMNDAGEAIPILDLGPYLAGEPEADLRLAAELRQACEEIGFYFITNHGVLQR